MLGGEARRDQSGRWRYFFAEKFNFQNTHARDCGFDNEVNDGAACYIFLDPLYCGGKGGRNQAMEAVAFETRGMDLIPWNDTRISSATVTAWPKST